MYGFQPKHALGKPAQALADGGIVHSLTGMLGMRKRTPEEMLAADAKVQERNREAAARVAARAKPAQQAAPAEEKAVSNYAGMSAMQRREQAAGLKDGGTVGGFKPGGLIRGPGTGTSDSIETEKRPGTFIMPADSTQAITPEVLAKLGATEEMPEGAELGEDDQGEGGKVPVRLSNGEFELPPEQVQALGEAVLTVMRNATHQPASGQEAPTDKGFTPHQFFADGGTVKPRGFVAGKGTGTSDSIPARLSNGEYVLPADTVKAVGVEALDSLRAATHTPVKHEQAKAAHGFFAGGTPGGVDEEKLKNSFGDAAAVARDASVTQVGGLANNGGADTSRFATVPAPIGTQPNRPVDAPAAAPAPSTPGGAVFGFYPQLAGGQRTTYATDAKLRTGVQATGPSTFAPATPSERTIIGGGNGQRMNAAQDPRSLTYGATAGNGTEAPVAPAAPNPTDQRIAAGAQQAPAAATQPASAMVAPGAYRNAPGQYSDNAAGMAMPAGFTGQPSAANNAILQRMSDQSQAESMARIGMSQYAAEVQHAKNINADEAARNNSVGARMQRLADPFSNEGRAMRNLQMNIDSSVGRKGRPTAKTEALVAQFKAMSDGYLAEPNQQRTIDAGLQREGMQQDGATVRTGMQEQGSNARDARRNALTAEELGLRREAAGFQTRAAAQQEQLRNTLIDPKATPEQRKQAQEYLQALAVSDKEPSPQYKSYVMPAIRNADGSTTEGGVYQENTRTGEGRWVKPQGDGQAQQAMPKAGEVRNGFRFKGGNPNDQANWTKV